MVCSCLPSDGMLVQNMVPSMTQLGVLLPPPPGWDARPSPVTKYDVPRSITTPPWMRSASPSQATLHEGTRSIVISRFPLVFCWVLPNGSLVPIYTPESGDKGEVTCVGTTQCMQRREPWTPEHAPTLRSRVRPTR